MRRKAAVVVSVLLVLSACGGGSSKKDVATQTTTSTAKPTTTTTTTTSERPETTTTALPARDEVALTATCPGIGDAPRAAEVTWVKDGKLWSAKVDGSDPHCLLEMDHASGLAWGGTGDRVLAGVHTIVLDDGPHALGAPDERLLTWSRPTGKALIAKKGDDTLEKISVTNDPLIDLYDAETSEAIYHPAGLSIVMVVPAAGPGVLMTSNTGENPRWVIENETAHAIHDLAFTADGDLLFVAEHDGGQHVHRLNLRTSTLTVLWEAPLGEHIGAIAASPWDDTTIATGSDCHGAGPMHVEVGGKDVDLSGTEVADGEPIGWTPDDSLVVLTHPDGDCGTGDLYAVTGTTATLIDHGVDAAAVRAVLPPPPPPPPEIEAAPA